MNASTAQGIRGSFTVGDRRLSYLDFGGQGTPLLALHGLNWRPGTPAT